MHYFSRGGFPVWCCCEWNRTHGASPNYLWAACRFTLKSWSYTGRKPIYWASRLNLLRTFSKSRTLIHLRSFRNWLTGHNSFLSTKLKLRSLLWKTLDLEAPTQVDEVKTGVYLRFWWRTIACRLYQSNRRQLPRYHDQLSLRLRISLRLSWEIHSNLTLAWLPSFLNCNAYPFTSPFYHFINYLIPQH